MHIILINSFKELDNENKKAIIPIHIQKQVIKIMYTELYPNSPNKKIKLVLF